jgi:hypothetical protein
MQNLNLTWAQDLGSVTELLSGDFFQPLGRSSSHQLWSSAMVISPLVRGLFGLDWDAHSKTIEVNPHLPGEWNGAKLRNVQLGPLSVDLEMERRASGLQVRVITKKPEKLCIVTVHLSDNHCAFDLATEHTVTVPLPAVEIGIPAQLPEPGDRTHQLKALSEEIRDHNATFVFEAQRGAAFDLPLRLNRPRTTVDGASIRQGELHVEFPAGEGYMKKTLTFKW